MQTNLGQPLGGGVQVVTVTTENWTCYKILLIVSFLGALYDFYDYLMLSINYAFVWQNLVYILWSGAQMFVYIKAFQNLRVRDVETQRVVTGWMKMVILISFIIYTTIIFLIPILASFGCSSSTTTSCNGIGAVFAVFFFVWLYVIFVACIIPFFTWKNAQRFLAHLENSKGGAVQVTYA